MYIIVCTYVYELTLRVSRCLSMYACMYVCKWAKRVQISPRLAMYVCKCICHLG